MLWLQEMTWCDYDENVDCGTRPICDENNENCYCEGETVCQTVDCSEDGYVEEGPCDKCLCQCEAGVAEEVCCSSGMVWDPADEACTDPAEVPSCDDKNEGRRRSFLGQARDNSTEITCPRE